jgi:inhibitor of KinA
MKLLPLGDQAVLVYLDDEQAAFRVASQVRAAAPGWLLDVVQAYASVGIFFNGDLASFAVIADWLRQTITDLPAEGATPPGRLHVIPCCYELQLDLEHVASHTGLGPEEVIRRHAETEYTVYAIGFCPGFPYLGYLPAELCGVPRLETPRLQVEAGSVGLTGKQTGIYTEVRPGGWNIIGRTPLELVNVADGYFPLRTGDRVRFIRIDEAEFRRLQGQRLY